LKWLVGQLSMDGSDNSFAESSQLVARDHDGMGERIWFQPTC